MEMSWFMRPIKWVFYKIHAVVNAVIIYFFFVYFANNIASHLVHRSFLLHKTFHLLYATKTPTPSRVYKGDKKI